VAFGAAAFSTLGIALAPLVPTAEGSSALVNAVYLPMLLLSGAFFPVTRLPGFLRWASEALPLTHLLDALRAVFRDGGVGSHELAGLLVTAAWAVGAAVFAARRFRWEPRVG
jgi:ABC-2 type transport system permease protein